MRRSGVPSAILLTAQDLVIICLLALSTRVGRHREFSPGPTRWNRSMRRCGRFPKRIDLCASRSMSSDKRKAFLSLGKGSGYLADLSTENCIVFTRSSLADCSMGRLGMVTLIPLTGLARKCMFSAKCGFCDTRLSRTVDPAFLRAKEL